MDGGGEGKGIVGMVGNEGIVVGMEEGRGGSATFGSVGMVGSVGSAETAVVAELAMGWWAAQALPAKEAMWD